MNHQLLVGSWVLAGLLAGSFSEAATPAGRTPVLKLREPKAQRYRTLLKREAGKPANFAGNFRLVNLGCGAGCADPAIIDLKRGEVYLAGFHSVQTGPGPDAKLLEFSLNSALLVVHG